MNVPLPDRPKSVLSIRENLMQTFTLLREMDRAVQRRMPEQVPNLPADYLPHVPSQINDPGDPANFHYGTWMQVFENRILSEEEDSRLVWVSPDMVSLMVEVSETIPEDIQLSEIPRPPQGMVIFGQSIVASDAVDQEREVQVDGFIWGPITVYDRKYGRARTGTSIAALTYTTRELDWRNGWFPLGRSEWMDDESFGQMDREEMWNEDTPWMPVLRTNESAVAGDEVAFDDNAHLTYYNSAMEDRRLLAALFGLMSQERHVELGTWRPHNKAEKRKHPDAAVATVTLRTASNDNPAAAGTGSKLDHRTYVAPYFRMQPHGPGRSLRRLQLIDGHIRGPEGAPLITRKKVWSLRK